MSITGHPLARLVLRASGASLLVALVSVCLIAIGVSLGDGFLRVFLLSVASAGFSIGGIGLLYETYLRRTQTQDVLALVRIEQSLSAAGIVGIERKPKIPWSAVFQSARGVVMIPADPIAWLNDEWVHVVDSDLGRGATVDLYLPRPDGPNAGELARRIGRDPATIHTQLTELLAQVEREWGAYVAGRPNPKPALQIFTYDGVPGIGITRADRHCVLVVPGIFETNPAQNTFALLFRADDDSLMQMWLKARIDTLTEVGRQFVSPEA